jgi:uncharacterized C2H2 Zn-finger protein
MMTKIMIFNEFRDMIKHYNKRSTKYLIGRDLPKEIN